MLTRRQLTLAAVCVPLIAVLTLLCVHSSSSFLLPLSFLVSYVIPSLKLTNASWLARIYAEMPVYSVVAAVASLSLPLFDACVASSAHSSVVFALTMAVVVVVLFSVAATHYHHFKDKWYQPFTGGNAFRTLQVGVSVVLRFLVL